MNPIAAKNSILAGLSVFGGYIANFFGGWDASMALLATLMALDYITGIMVAGIWKRSNKSTSGALDSKAGFKGLCKKCAVLMLVLLGAELDRALGISYARTMVILFFIGNEGLSLLENLGLMGVPYPAFLQRMLEALHDEGDQGKEQK